MWDLKDGITAVFCGVEPDRTKHGNVYVKYIAKLNTIGQGMAYLFKVKPKVRKLSYSLPESSIWTVKTYDVNNGGEPLEIKIILPPDDDPNSVLSQIKGLGLEQVLSLKQQVSKLKYNSAMAKTDFKDKNREIAEINKNDMSERHDPYKYRNKNIDNKNGVDYDRNGN